MQVTSFLKMAEQALQRKCSVNDSLQSQLDLARLELAAARKEMSQVIRSCGRRKLDLADLLNRC